MVGGGTVRRREGEVVSGAAVAASAAIAAIVTAAEVGVTRRLLGADTVEVEVEVEAGDGGGEFDREGSERRKEGESERRKEGEREGGVVALASVEWQGPDTGPSRRKVLSMKPQGKAQFHCNTSSQSCIKISRIN
jgi:hypothetical protein